MENFNYTIVCILFPIVWIGLYLTLKRERNKYAFIVANLMFLWMVCIVSAVAFVMIVTKNLFT